MENKLNIRTYSGEIYDKNKLWYEHLKSVLSLFEKEKIDYAIIKGQVLSKTAYGREGFRDSSDIDILISPQNVSRVMRIMEKCGFRQAIYNENGEFRQITRKEKMLIANSHQIVPYVKKLLENQEVNIDINIDIFWGEYSGKRFDIKQLLKENSSYVQIYGIDIRTLTKLYHFIEVCLHHYKEMNAVYSFKYHNPFTTQMFEDIYRLFVLLSESELNELNSICQSYNLNLPIYYVIYYSSLVFNDKRMNDFGELIKTEEAQEGLEMYGLSIRERKKWLIPFEERLDIDNLYEKMSPFLEINEIEKANAVLSIFG